MDMYLELSRWEDAISVAEATVNKMVGGVNDGDARDTITWRH